MSGGTKTVGLREAREQAMRNRPPGELTQKAVAAALRPPISEMTLRRWELGRNAPRNPGWYFPQFAEMYGVDVENLNGKMT